MKYKNRYWKNRVNKKYWDEVFVGRMITSLEWKKGKLVSLILNNGEKVFVNPGGIYISSDGLPKGELE